MTQIGSSTRMFKRLALLGLAIALVDSAMIVGGARPTAAQGIEGDAEVRAYWQERYRNLRLKEARLVQTERLATKEYADANRRTYRRSGVRHYHRANAEAAKADLELVRADLAAIYDEGRAAGIPIFWLDEVAEQPIDMDRVEGLGVYGDDGQFGGRGAYAPAETEEGEEGPMSTDDGRNPLFSGEGDEPASLDDFDSKRFDYEAWRQDRGEYERGLQPEEELELDEVEPD